MRACTMKRQQCACLLGRQIVLFDFEHPLLVVWRVSSTLAGCPLEG
ncbi:protein of unassigned function [Methylobacterium oryzae CBMB20]|uniref:Protein of unassigned function n=1 Tax=Methylobacterium oryzae CBMB20 TaxID=693986 RepID=A0A089NWK8_9HYPH|nr:protein of unassigned function [Methylobacterium oryzae CBMB20]